MTRTPQPTPLADSRRGGFTLIEIMVVVGLIALLVAIGVTVGSAMRGEAKRQVTIHALENAHTILAEYQAEVGASPSDNTSSAAASVQAFVDDVRDYPATKDMLLMLKDHYNESDRSITDSWGNSLWYLQDSDNSTLPVYHNRPFLASAGPDGDFSTHEDNLYSFELE